MALPSGPGATALGLGVLAAVAMGAALRRRRRRDDAAPRHGARPDRLPAPPTVGGRYRLGGELGRGATGIVHLAEDLRGGALVALKTVRLPPARDGDLDAREVRDRFFREADAAGRLRHPDIVTVLDAGEDAEGLAWLAMERLPGTDLSAHTRAGALLPVATALETVARVALALDHAHRHGVVHRDVKPANIVLDRASGGVKVTDFGIASIADAERTRTGVLLGTPLYMAPEQLAGGRVDGRSDLYSLGVVLFELLTGTLPYPGGTMAGRLRRIADDTPPPDVRERRPALPAEVARVVECALQKPSAHRPADGRAFAAALRKASRHLGAGPDDA